MGNSFALKSYDTIPTQSRKPKQGPRPWTKDHDPLDRCVYIYTHVVVTFVQMNNIEGERARKKENGERQRERETEFGAEAFFGCGFCG